MYMYHDSGTVQKPYEISEEIPIGKIPILGAFDCYHTHPMFFMPGCMVELNALKKMGILMEYPLEK